MGWILAIDGGGTKTDMLLLGPAGERWRGRGGPSSLTRGSAPAVREQLRRTLRPLLDEAGIRATAVSAVCGGFAGAARPEARARLEAMLRELLPAARLRVTTDLEIALAASGHDDVIVVIAGTGSAAVGRRDARVARAGGTRPPGGDPGSGEWLAAHPGAAADAGEALAALALQVAAQLDLREPYIGWTGSVLRRNEPVRRSFFAALRRGLPAAMPAAASLAPLRGALALARQLDRQP